MTYDNMRNAHGRLKMIAIGSSPNIFLELSWRYVDCPSVTSANKVRCDCLLTASDGSASCLVRLKRVRNKPITMLPMLASIESELTI